VGEGSTVARPRGSTRRARRQHSRAQRSTRQTAASSQQPVVAYPARVPRGVAAEWRERQPFRSRSGPCHGSPGRQGAALRCCDAAFELDPSQGQSHLRASDGARARTGLGRLLACVCFLRLPSALCCCGAHAVAAGGRQGWRARPLARRRITAHEQTEDFLSSIRPHAPPAREHSMQQEEPPALGVRSCRRLSSVQRPASRHLARRSPRCSNSTCDNAFTLAAFSLWLLHHKPHRALLRSPLSVLMC